MLKTHLAYYWSIAVCLCSLLANFAHAEQPSKQAAKKALAAHEYPTPEHVPAVVCGACHEKIYEQWSRSMHAHSAPGNDAILTKVYEEMVGSHTEEGLTLNGKYPSCLKCHAPNAAKEEKTKLDQLNYSEGVNCVNCHVFSGFKGMKDEEGKQQYGLDAYERSKTHLQSPSGRYLNPYDDAQHGFPMQPSQLMLRTSRVCLGCHGEFHNEAGVAMYQTGQEYMQNEGKNVTCQSCHMPKVDGEANHAILSAHSDAALARPIVVQLDAKPTGDKLSLDVSLQNTLPHRFPTGNPFRYATLHITAYDKDNKLIWRNYEGFPPDFSKDPKAILRYEVADKDGKPVMAYKAEKVLKDSRLQPFETRVLNYSLPAKSVHLLRAELHYHLLTPDVIEKYRDVLEGNATTPAIAAIAELKLKN